MLISGKITEVALSDSDKELSKIAILVTETEYLAQEEQNLYVIEPGAVIYVHSATSLIEGVEIGYVISCVLDIDDTGRYVINPEYDVFVASSIGDEL